MVDHQAAASTDVAIFFFLLFVVVVSYLMSVYGHTENKQINLTYSLP